MIRSLTALASICGAAGVSCAAGLALAYTHDLAISSTSASVQRGDVLVLPVRTPDALLEPLPGLAFVTDRVAEPSVLAVSQSPRPVSRLAQADTDDHLPQPPNQMVESLPVAPVLSFHQNVVTAPVRGVPIEEWAPPRGDVVDNQMPKINNVWRSGVYR